jgi:hypothetical protein
MAAAVEVIGTMKVAWTVVIIMNMINEDDRHSTIVHKKDTIVHVLGTSGDVGMIVIIAAVMINDDDEGRVNPVETVTDPNQNRVATL